MSEHEYNIIVKILCNGAPALANELIDALNRTIDNANKYVELLENTDKE